MWTDTHCHLGDPAFDADRRQVVERMRAAGVGRALVIESDMARLDATRRWASSEPDIAIATGCHPHDASQWSLELRSRLERLWRDGSAAGAGEMGLDYHYDHSPRDVQQQVFREQLAVAVACQRPVIIHAREADRDVVDILEEQPGATVILHSFSSGPVLRDAGLRNGWYFSFSGMVTFRKWADHDTVRAVAADRLLLETDAPYLAPVPHRGKRNEPAFVAEVGRQVAEIRGVGMEALAEATSANARRLFWPQDDSELG